MTLAAVVDALAMRLVAALDLAVTVGDIEATDVAELPTVALSIDDASQQLAGVGQDPQGPQSGALPTTVTVDLADPRLRLDDETIDLLSPDRLALTAPLGPIVRADGTDGPPFAAADVQIDDGTTPYEVVAGMPTGPEVAVDPAGGRFVFGQALPSTGTMTVTFHLGRWEVVTTRHTGTIHLDVMAATGAEAATISRQIAAELALPAPPFERLDATAWAAATPVSLTDGPAVRQRQSRTFAFEDRTPLVPGGGGVIRIVAATTDTDGAIEQFTVPAATAATP